MIAHCLYALAGGDRLETSDLIQLSWQGLIQEALSGEESFRVLYMPFEREDKAGMIEEATKAFAGRHPDFSQHIFTDPHGIHLLPEGAESLPDQQYLLTLGFRNKEMGKIVEKSVTRHPPTCTGQKTPFSPSTEEEAETFWENTRKKVLVVMDFIGSTKIKEALIEEELRELEEDFLRSREVETLGMETTIWAPTGQENVTVFHPNP